MKNKKKIIKFGLISFPILLASGSAAIYYFIKSRNTTNTISDKDLSNKLLVKNSPNNKIDQLEIFPKLSSYDFYKYIRIKNNDPVINDKLVAALINKVIKDMKYTTGTVHWAVNKISIKHVNIIFVWVPNAEGQDSIKKTYELKLIK